MEIIDLNEEYEGDFLVCLEDWSDDMKEAGDRRRLWYDKMKDRGLRAKLALDEAGVAGGMIQYAPAEESLVSGHGLYFINCIWVHGHKQGRGNYRKKGMGVALLEAAEADVRELGAAGMAAWGISLPFWMKASWFRKHGYRKADRQGIMVLLWKPFSDSAAPPRWIKRRKKPQRTPGRVTVTSFVNGWCPSQNLTYERAKRAAAEFGDAVRFQEYDTFDREVLAEWGIADGLYIDGRAVRSGPPPSYDRIRKAIAVRVRKL